MLGVWDPCKGIKICDEIKDKKRLCFLKKTFLGFKQDLIEKLAFFSLFFLVVVFRPFSKHVSISTRDFFPPIEKLVFKGGSYRSGNKTPTIPFVCLELKSYWLFNQPFSNTFWKKKRKKEQKRKRNCCFNSQVLHQISPETILQECRNKLTAAYNVQILLK